jgi:hypothetical protein
MKKFRINKTRSTNVFVTKDGETKMGIFMYVREHSGYDGAYVNIDGISSWYYEEQITTFDEIFARTQGIKVSLSMLSDLGFDTHILERELVNLTHTITNYKDEVLP